MEQPSREELERMLEKAKRDLQAKLDQMTPEEREKANLAAKKRIEEDQASMQKLLDDAERIAGGAAKAAPKFCGNCGAPTNGGKFCAYCGTPL